MAYVVLSARDSDRFSPLCPLGTSDVDRREKPGTWLTQMQDSQPLSEGRREQETQESSRESLLLKQWLFILTVGSSRIQRLRPHHQVYFVGWGETQVSVLMKKHVCGQI